MKTVPHNGGTVPLRGSKNPVLGVFRHHCGSIATVHQPKGKKAHLRYLLCDVCKCDQASGDEYQAKIRANTYENIEALMAVEDESQPAVSVTSEPSETPSDAVPTVNELVEIVEPLPAPEVTEPETVKKPLETARTAVPTVKPVESQATDPQLAPKPSQTATNGVSTASTVAGPAEPQPNATANDPKPARIGLAAVIGAVFGGLLAMVA